MLATESLETTAVENARLCTMGHTILIAENRRDRMRMCCLVMMACVQDDGVVLDQGTRLLLSEQLLWAAGICSSSEVMRYGGAYVSAPCLRRQLRRKATEEGE